MMPQAMIDALLAESRWLTRLAAALAGEGDAADELAQQTWLQALESPPHDRRNLRGWLATVARNIWRGRHLAEQRRAARERAAPIAEPPATPEEAVARAELRRRVVEAVLALDEPYRSTLVMSFFEEMSAAAIAALVGAPVETIRTRRKRGLARLRERLAVERDERGRPLAGVLLAFAGGNKELLLMTTGAKSLIGAAAAAALLVTAIVLARGGDARPPVTPLPAIAAAPASSGSLPESEPIEAVRDNVATTPEDDVTKDLARSAITFTLTGVVRDATGEPVADATVALLPEESSRPTRELALIARIDRGGTALDLSRLESSREARTDADGRFEFAATSAFGSWWLGAFHPVRGIGVATLLRVEPGAHRETEITLQRLGTIRVHVVDATGEPIANAFVVNQKDGSSTGRGADERGAITFFVLGSGRYSLHATKSGLTPSRAVEVELTETSLEARVDLVCGEGAVRKLAGRWRLPDGSPVAPATLLGPPLTALGHDVDELLLAGFAEDPAATTTTRGKHLMREFFDDDFMDDCWEATVTRSEIQFVGLLAADVLVASAAIPADGSSPDLVIDVGRLQGERVLCGVVVRITAPGDPASAPIKASLSVGHTTGDAHEGSSISCQEIALTPGEVWTQRLAPRAATHLVFCVEAPGFATAWASCIADAATEREVTITLQPAGARLLGAVVTDDGAPATDGQVALYVRNMQDGERWEPAGRDVQSLTGEGRFEFDSLCSGEHLIVVRVKGRAAAAAIVEASGDAQPVPLTSHAGVACSLRILKEQGEQAPQQFLRVLDRDGAPVWDDQRGMNLFFRDRRSYELRLLPGAYSAEVTRPGGATARVEFTAVEGAEITIPLPQ